MNTTATLIFVIASFALGAVTVMKRDTLQPKLRKWLAISSIFFITFAFILIVSAFFTMGSE